MALYLGNDEISQKVLLNGNVGVQLPEMSSNTNGQILSNDGTNPVWVDEQVGYKQISNCITEIPQDIKLELNSDYSITLKAGSKLYIPNGFETDGTTRKFDTKIIESDINFNASTYATYQHIMSLLPTNLIQDALSRGLYQSNNAGEARLFYTALTRSERFLYVTGSAIHEGLARAKRPSPYKLRLTNLNHSGITTDETILPENVERIEPKARIDEESMPTSFTEIKDYLECPMKYRFRKIYGFSPAVPELFVYVLTTHTAINRLHQLYPESAPTREEAQEIASDVFHLKHVFPSRNSDGEGPYERAKSASKKLVGNYANDYPNDFIQSRSLEQRFEIKAGKALITGAIDLLLKEDTNGNILDAKVLIFSIFPAKIIYKIRFLQKNATI